MAERPDIVKEARANLELSWQHDRENREEAASDLKFVAGDQWDESDRRQRESEDRPVITINKMPAFIRQTTNDIRQNAPAIRTIPAGGDADSDMAEIITGLLRQIQYQSSATHVYSGAVESAAMCGIGHFRIATDYVDDTVFEQEIQIEPIANPQSVYWDPAAVKPDRSDAMWCLVTERIPHGTFKKKYPNAAVTDMDAPTDNATDGLYWATGDDVMIAEYWRKVPVEIELALLHDGKTVNLSDASEMEKLFLYNDKTIAQRRTAQSFKVEQYIVSGEEILEDTAEFPGKHIPIIPVIGSEIHLERKTYRHGMVRFARDPQRLYNYYRSAAAENISQSPKSPMLATHEQIKAYKAQWDSANTQNRPYLLYKPDPKAATLAPQRIPQAEVPVAFYQEQQIASQDMNDTIGIQDAGLGKQSNETSGVAINARKLEGDTANFHYGDNLAFSLKHAALVIIGIIPEVYDTARTIRILGEDDAEKFIDINQPTIGVDGLPQLFNDISVGRFDVRVKMGPSYSSRREQSQESMLGFVQAFPMAAPAVADLVASNMDWPGADQFAERLKKMVPPEYLGESDREEGEEAQQPPEPDPIQKMGIELEMREKKAQIDKLEADTNLQKAKTAETMASIGQSDTAPRQGALAL